MLIHLTAIYASRIKLVTDRAGENTVRGYEDLSLPAEFRPWFESPSAGNADAGERSIPDGLLPLFHQTAARTEDILWSVAPEEPVWTWWPADQTAGFWQRRMAHETAVHRWDAQVAHNFTEPIESNLAADGIDETFDVMLPRRRGAVPDVPLGAGESFHFHRTDGPGEWLVRFEPDGPVVSREHAKADVAVRGPASDLVLFLWHRIPAARLDVVGDATRLERYFELVPPS